MDIFRDLIYEQNKNLLINISNDFFPNIEKEKIEFINEYHKKNFNYMIPINRDQTVINQKRLKKIIK